MSKDLFSRYIWLVDLIKRNGHITREEINRRWIASGFSDGKPMPRRTFYNYKIAVEQLFNIKIENDPKTYEYYISDEDAHQESVTNWLLNSTATSGLITASRDVSDRVFLEEVPSAREYLPLVIDSLRTGRAIKFDYHPYTRSLPTKGVVVEPYFTKIFKQRWYVIGRNVKEKKIKTYALDRMKNAEQLTEEFKMPADFNPDEYFTHAFGIVVDQSDVKHVKLKVESTQAKYFRALPLHHTQEEMVGDHYSIFSYKMRVTADFVAELLSYGAKVTVLEPYELKTAMKMELEKSLANYKK